MPETTDRLINSLTDGPFGRCLIRYRRARAKADKIHGDAVIIRLDAALDALLAVPSPSPAAFGLKLRILEFEYGLDVQPRHMKAIYTDVDTLERPRVVGGRL